jgi:MYXO-CTERM domain-containing protein
VNRSLLVSSIALVLIGASTTASADLLTPDESACSGKKASDACATTSGAAGTCMASVDTRGRTHLECKAGAALLQPTPTATATATAAPQPTTTATPKPTSAPAPSPSAAAPPASSCSAGIGAAGSTGALVPLIFAALAALRRRRR